MQGGIQLMISIFFAGIIYVTFRGVLARRTNNYFAYLISSLWDGFEINEVRVELVLFILLYFVLQWLSCDSKKYSIFSLFQINFKDRLGDLILLVNFLVTLSLQQTIFFFIVNFSNKFMQDKTNMIPISIRPPLPVQFTKMMTFSYLLFFMSLYFAFFVSSTGGYLVLVCMKTIFLQVNIIIDGIDQGNSDSAVNASQYIDSAFNIFIAVYYIVCCIYRYDISQIMYPNSDNFNMRLLLVSAYSIFLEVTKFVRMKEISHQLDGLPTVKPEKDDLCIICRLEYEEGEEAKRIPCGHTFHVKCLERWIKSHSRCPICEQEIKFDGTMVNMYETHTHDHNHENNEQNGDEINNDFQQHLNEQGEYEMPREIGRVRQGEYEMPQELGRVRQGEYEMPQELGRVRQGGYEMPQEVDFRHFDDDNDQFKNKEKDPNTFDFADFDDVD